MSILEKCTHIVDSCNNAISKLLWGNAGFQVSLYTTPCGNPECSNRIPLAVRKAKPSGTRCNCSTNAKGAGSGKKGNLNKFRSFKISSVKNSLIDISSSSLSNLSNRLIKLKKVCPEGSNSNRFEFDKVVDIENGSIEEDSSLADETLKGFDRNILSKCFCIEESKENLKKSQHKKRSIPLKYIKIINTGNIKKDLNETKERLRKGTDKFKLKLSDSAYLLNRRSRELLAKASSSYVSFKDKIKISTKWEKIQFERSKTYDTLTKRFNAFGTQKCKCSDCNADKVTFNSERSNLKSIATEGKKVTAAETTSRGTKNFGNISLENISTLAKRIRSSLSTSDFDNTLSCLSHLSDDLQNRLLKFECAACERKTPGFFNVPQIPIGKFTSKLNTKALSNNILKEDSSRNFQGKESSESSGSGELEKSQTQKLGQKSKSIEKYKDNSTTSTSSEGSSVESSSEVTKNTNKPCSGKPCRWTCLNYVVRDAGTNTSSVDFLNINNNTSQTHKKSKEFRKDVIPTSCEVKSLSMSPVLSKRSYYAKLPGSLQLNSKPTEKMSNKEQIRVEIRKGLKVFGERPLNVQANYVTKEKVITPSNTLVRTHTDEASSDNPTTDKESLCLRVEVSEDSVRSPLGRRCRAEEERRAEKARKPSDDIVADLTKSIMELNEAESNGSLFFQTNVHTSNVEEEIHLEERSKSSELNPITENESKEMAIEEVIPIEEKQLRRKVSWAKYKEPPINPPADAIPKIKKKLLVRFLDAILRHDKSSFGSDRKLRRSINKNRNIEKLEKEIEAEGESQKKNKFAFGNKKSFVIKPMSPVHKKDGFTNLSCGVSYISNKSAVEYPAELNTRTSVSTLDSEDLRTDEMFLGRRIMDSVEKMMLQMNKKKGKDRYLAVVRKHSQRYLPMAQRINNSVPKIGSHLFRRSAVSVEKKKGRLKPKKSAKSRQDSLIRRISSFFFKNSRDSNTSNENEKQVDKFNGKIDVKDTNEIGRQLSSALKKGFSAERKRSVNFVDNNDSEQDSIEHTKVEAKISDNMTDVSANKKIPEFIKPGHQLVSAKPSNETISTNKAKDALVKNDDGESVVTESNHQSISDSSDASTSSDSSVSYKNSETAYTVTRQKSLVDSSSSSVLTDNKKICDSNSDLKINGMKSNTEKKTLCKKDQEQSLRQQLSLNCFSGKVQMAKNQEINDKKISSTLFRQRQNNIEMQENTAKDASNHNALKGIPLDSNGSSSFDIEENPETVEIEDIIPIKKVSRTLFKKNSENSLFINNQAQVSSTSGSENGKPRSLIKRMSSLLVFKRSSSSIGIDKYRSKFSNISLIRKFSNLFDRGTFSADDKQTSENGKKLAPSKKMSSLFKRTKKVIGNRVVEQKSRGSSTVLMKPQNAKNVSVDPSESLIDAHLGLIQKRLDLPRKVAMADKTTNVCPRSRLKSSNTLRPLKESSYDRIIIPRNFIYGGNSTNTATDEEDDESRPPLISGSDLEQISKRVRRINVQYVKMPFRQNTKQTQLSERKIKRKDEGLQFDYGRAKFSPNSHNMECVTPFKNSEDKDLKCFEVAQRLDSKNYFAIRRKDSLRSNDSILRDQRLIKHKNNIECGDAKVGQEKVDESHNKVEKLKENLDDTVLKEKKHLLIAKSKLDNIFCPNCPEKNLKKVVQKLSKNKIDALMQYTKSNKVKLSNKQVECNIDERGMFLQDDPANSFIRRIPILTKDAVGVEDIKMAIVHRLAFLVQHYYGVKVTRACQFSNSNDNTIEVNRKFQQKCKSKKGHTSKSDTSSVILQESSSSSPSFSDVSKLSSS